MRNGVDSFECCLGASANLQLLESGKPLPFGNGLVFFAKKEEKETSKEGTS